MFYPFLLVIFICFTKECYCIRNPGSCSSYMRLTARHTMCSYPNLNCMFLRKGVNEEDIHLILKLHNFYRSKVATGNEVLGGMLPSAADMLEMTWDDELATIAQKHAEKCIYGHDCNECRAVDHFPVGQNIARKLMHLMPVKDEKDWNWFTKILYDEVAWFPKSIIKAYVQGPHDPITQYGHFSQIIWANTWRIGCGWVLFQDGYFNSSYYVCNYGPGGNVDNKKVYTEGPICSSCPRNSCCGEQCAEFNIPANYPALCKVINERLPPDSFAPRDASDYFFCDFSNEIDCQRKLTGKQDWQFRETIGGNWISIILNGGHTATLLMTKPFMTLSPIFCFKVVLRTGAQVEGQSYYLGGVITFLQSDGSKAIFTIKGNAYRTQFVPYSMNVLMPAGVEIMVLLAFTVANGVPPQYLDIKEISARAGRCPLGT